MSQRLSQIKDHLVIYDGKIQNKSPDDVVIVAAYRTPIGKGFKGVFKDINTDYLLCNFLIEFFEKTNIEKELIDEVVCGNVLNPGSGATEHRAACLAAGIPYDVSFMAINRQCSSGLSAVNDVANKIKTGQIDVGLALGVESMSKNYGPKALGEISNNLKMDKNASRCLIPMGITNENLVKLYQISRKDQDEYAAHSYAKAEQAIFKGLFKDEILPIKLPNGNIINIDEGPRKGVTADSLSKIKPAFIRNEGTTTAGNSSQISDGAAGVLLAKRLTAVKYGWPIIGKYVAFQTIGVPPEIMGVGPAYAIPKVLRYCQLDIDDVSVFEINEAFAGQALYCINKLKISLSKVNPRGGSIALGHPLGCTGARQVATLLRELNRGELGVCSMCIGTGMGAAAVFVKE